MKKVVIALSLVVVVLGGYLVINELSKNNNINLNESNKGNEKVYNVNDYVNINKVNSNLNDIEILKVDEKEFENFKSIKDEFLLKEENKDNDSIEKDYSSEISYQIYKNVLSVMFNGDEVYSGQEPVPYPTEDNIATSVNINLDDNKKLSFEEVCEMFDVKVDSVLKLVLKDLADGIEFDYLLEGTEGDISQPQVEITDFKSNIDKYKDVLKKSDYEKVINLYIKDNKLMCTYDDSRVLANIDLSSHMGIGLVNKYVTLEVK